MSLFKRNRSLFIHETTTLTAADFETYNRAFSEHYQPVMERQGARLFGHWRDIPFNSHWNEVTTIWEIDDLSHFGALSMSRVGSGKDGESFTKWEKSLVSMGAKGEGRLCYGNEGIKSLADLKSENFNASGVIQEFMTTKPGMQDDYLSQLKLLFVPWFAELGMKWLGSFVTQTRNEEVIHYWAVEGGWNNYGKSPGLQPAEIQEIMAKYKTWMLVAPAMRESWDDSFLAALPQHPLTG